MDVEMLDLEFSGIGGALSGALNTGYIILIAILVMLLVAGIAWIIWYVLAFKHQVIVMQVTNNRNICVVDRARNVKDKSGKNWWKLQKLKDKIPEPPTQAIQITPKGKKVFFCYYLEDAGYIPAKDQSKFKKLLSKRNSEQVSTSGYVAIQNNLSYQDFKNYLSEEFDPFDTNQRNLLINELIESERYKKKSLSDLVVYAAPFVTLIVIIALLLGFWGDVVKPFTENNKLAVKAMEQATELIREMRLANSGSSIINSATLINNTGVPD